jgi:hypothetical protein
MNLNQRGCSDILLIWMENYGLIIGSFLIIGGILDIIFSILLITATSKLKSFMKIKYYANDSL